MSINTFVKNLIISALIALILLVATHFVVDMREHVAFIVSAYVFFVAFCIFIYWLAQRSSKSKAGEYFLYIVVVNVFVKLIASFMMVFIYAKLAEPSDKWFVIPFLIIYLVFTVFETFFLSIQAKHSQK
ncbi:MAG: hypothetical protein HKN09_03040 [Saprospiraceae bacterium]|nr:hypothetical protein [Saprospiraceae bacterium]